MARTLFAVCLVFGLLTIGCSQRKAGGPPPPPTKGQPTSFPDCKSDPSHPGPVKEAEWSGTEMCNQEGQKDAHYALPAVQISKGACPGIHIKHDQDFTLELGVRSDPNGTCPANPFNNKFPFDSTKAGSKEFHTDKAKDNAVGCSYEITFKPKTGTRCDPHIDITP